jgi:hypothetical protein
LLGNQILPNPLSRELLIDLGQDQTAKGLALTRSAPWETAGPGGILSLRAGGQNGCI